MTPADPSWGAAPAPELQWTAKTTPHSLAFNDIYYSSSSGLEESRHVFLRGNKLPLAWRDRQRFVIFETGFGTGLNFLSTWQAWLEDGNRALALHYIAVEKYPLRLPDLQQALSSWPTLQALSSQLCASYPPPLPGRHRLIFEQGKVLLDLILTDAKAALGTLVEEPQCLVDCWYLDGFAPSRNPDMWEPALYTHMAHLSRPNASFATFTAAGQVRRGLQDAGFAVEKVTGYGSKRDMLRGRFQGRSQGQGQGQGQGQLRRTDRTPWHISPTPKPAGRTAAVLGAGLAGANIANALARRGWQVRIFEQDEVASAASGNLQGVLYTRISHRRSELNDFTLHSFCFASRFYRELLRSGQHGAGADGDLCGALHLHSNCQPIPALEATVAGLPELARYLDADQARQLSGLPDCPAGLYYPQAGWMRPTRVCQALLSAYPSIELQEHCGQLQLHRAGDLWLVQSANGEELCRAAVAVIATGIQANNTMQGLQWLPLQTIRGQVSHIPSNEALAQLRTVICHDGYIAPAIAGQHCIGATFDIGDRDELLRAGDHALNLEKLAQALPQSGLTAGAMEELSGRVGFRCASPDYLPIAGPVPDYEAFVTDYSALRKNAKRVIDRNGSYLPGLYLSTAHGSRGLTSTPLTAELVAAQINGESWPVDSNLCRALNPARFIVRDLIRNRI